MSLSKRIAISLPYYKDQNFKAIHDRGSWKREERSPPNQYAQYSGMVERDKKMQFNLALRARSTSWITLVRRTASGFEIVHAFGIGILFRGGGTLSGTHA